jgi:hypothetical protein
MQNITEEIVHCNQDYNSKHPAHPKHHHHVMTNKKTSKTVISIGIEDDNNKFNSGEFNSEHDDQTKN